MDNINTQIKKPLIVRDSESGINELGSLWKKMQSDFLDSLHPAWELAKRDLRGAYRQSILGFFWILLPPLITTALWICLNQAGITRMEASGLPYAIFVTAGTILWSSFTDALNSPRNQISANLSSLSNLNFPPETIFLSGIIQVAINFMVRILILVGMILWFRQSVSIYSWIYIPCGMLVIFFGFSAGLYLVPFSSLYKDVGQIINLALPLFMFLAPVVYEVPEGGVLRLFMLANPLTYIVDCARSSLHTLPSLADFIGVGICMLLACGLLVVGWFFNRLTLHHLVERS
jgi:lipopolysaccharide transport system permease protein